MQAYYFSSIKNFLQETDSQILGELTKNHFFNLETLQRNAWLQQIKILKDSLKNISEGYLFFEFIIPRMGKRVDNIIIIGDLIFIIEFKVGESKYDKNAKDQLLDYCLDLKNFHQGSHNEKLIPILVSTCADNKINIINKQQDLLYDPVFANKNNLQEVISLFFSERGQKKIDPKAWLNSTYKPTPTIIEAAQVLYRGHNVKEISRSDSGAVNLSKTTEAINKIIEKSKEKIEKSICFVTGVPGSGKTLAGLNIANERTKIDERENAVFLSGNGPLLEVLTEALTRDKIKFCKENRQKITKKEVERSVYKMIQNIHHFRDAGLSTDKKPDEKVVIFDEAQRAWTEKQASSFMVRKKRIGDFSYSEPEFLIKVMDRHDDWCVIVCLVGGGQEINVGEAGLEEWISSLKNSFPGWKIYFSELISSDKDYLNNEELKKWLLDNGKAETSLHLAASMRSFRSEKVSQFVHDLLEKKTQSAKNIYNEIQMHYPIYITRDINMAKKWVKNKARGSERYGVLASSTDKRLRPFGIDVKNDIDSSNWFLGGKEDIRSSYFMEDVATEFEIQGLELDWSVVAWGADLSLKKGSWLFRSFRGTNWQKINQQERKRYLINAYRVLLTRARQGFVIFLPKGSDGDRTRESSFYDETYDYLANHIGIKIL